MIFLVNMYVFFPLNNKKDIKITNTFQKLLEKSNNKPNKIWVGKVSDLYAYIDFAVENNDKEPKF